MYKKNKKETKLINSVGKWKIFIICNIDDRQLQIFSQCAHVVSILKILVENRLPSALLCNSLFQDIVSLQYWDNNLETMITGCTNISQWVQISKIKIGKQNYLWFPPEHDHNLNGPLNMWKKSYLLKDISCDGCPVDDYSLQLISVLTVSQYNMTIWPDVIRSVAPSTICTACPIKINHHT